MGRASTVMCARCGATKQAGQPCAACLQRKCDQFNQAYPVGTEVEYHPVIGEPAHRVRTTRTPAQVLSGHTAVVWLNDESGCVALDAVVVRKEN